MSDEARAEGEQRMHEQREQTRYIEGVLAGAEWQAECDAERLADLAAEVARLRREFEWLHKKAGRTGSKLAAVRALAVDQTVTRTDRLRRILAVIDGGDET